MLTNKTRGFLPRGSATHNIRGNNYLIGIGIDQYVHCTPLSNAVRDVQEFVKIMHEKFDFEPDYTQTLYNEAATEANILQVFRTLAVEVEPEDTVVIYFSGHGEYINEIQQGFWVPVDAEPDTDAHYIENSTIIARLNAIKSKHIFLISDACFSGTLFLNTRSISKKVREDLPSRWGLTSGHQELVSDGTAGGHSPFAASILKTLKQKHTERSLGVEEFCFEVKQLASRKAPNQTPISGQLNVKGNEYGQMIFHLKGREKQAWLAARSRNTIVAYQDFLNTYPHGLHVKAAKLHIKLLENQQFIENDVVREKTKVVIKDKKSQKKSLTTMARIANMLPERRNWKYIIGVALVVILTLIWVVLLFNGKFTSNAVGIDRFWSDMVLVRGGAFDMGSGQGSQDEQPIHAVTIGNFYMGKYEVTQAQWELIMGYNPSEFKCETCPVEHVSWTDVQKFITKLNRKTGGRYRLPTEAEWEYAARGGAYGNARLYDNTHLMAMASDIDVLAWYHGNSEHRTHPIGDKQANVLGLHDMVGNVWE